MQSSKDNKMNTIDLFYLSRKKQENCLNNINDKLNNDNLVNDITTNYETIKQTTDKLLEDIIHNKIITTNNDNLMYIEQFKIYLRLLSNYITRDKKIENNQQSIDQYLKDISYNNVKKNIDISLNKYNINNDIDIFTNIDIDSKCRQNIKKFAINNNSKKKILPKKIV
tara:strand:- start:1615 stop:2118 length:504 start_codon:yes stop_codon:yes gene_type:complete